MRVWESLESQYDPYLNLLLGFHNTPSQGSGYKPTQKCHGRRTHTLLPTSSKWLKPLGSNVDKVKSDKNQRNQRSMKYYNVHAKDLEFLAVDDIVRIKPTSMGKNEWDKGIVKQHLDERSSEISTDTGVL